MSNKSKQYIFIGGVIISLLLVIYNFTLNQKTEIKIELPLDGSQIIINRENLITPQENQISLKLKEGKNEIIVTKEGYFPWTKNLNIENKKEITLKPFLISQSPSGQIITPNDPEYFQILEKINSKNVPSKNNPIINEQISIFVSESNEIILAKNNTEEIIIKPILKIKNVEFYKNRNDVLIFGTEDGIYAIDIYGNDNQRNFMPIYKGENTSFILGERSDYIYVSDTNSLMVVML